MIKRDIYSCTGGMNTDAPPSRRDKSQYFLLRNGRISGSFSSGDSNNIVSDKLLRCQGGNDIKFQFTSIESISNISGDLVVSYKESNILKIKTFVGVINSEISSLNSSLPDTNIYVVCAIGDGPNAYFLTSSESSIDCVWRFNEYDGLELLYINSLGWNNLVEKNFDVVINTESESVIKMYIADGEHQIFSVNLVGVHDLSKPKKSLYMVPQYELSQPKLVNQINSGAHTSGAIQYVFNLFNINGGQTKISPVSELIFLGKSNGGGDVNEVIGKSNIIRIDNIDTSYDYIKIYSIKYNDFQTTPIVSIIGEYAVNNTTSLTITDDGRSDTTITIEELSFLGGTEVVPRCIINKKNRLLLANITEDIFDINDGLLVDNVNYFDSRTYSTTYAGINVIISDKTGALLYLDKTGRAYTSSGLNVPIRHDCIQDKRTNLYHPVDNTVPGGEGRHISYKIIKTTLSDIISNGYDPNSSRYMKSGETYRWAIEFYNNKSQKSTPQWIADIKIPEDYLGFIDDTRVTIEFSISSNGSTILQNQGIIGYKFLRVERLESDKTIIAQGIVSPMIFQETSDAAKNNANEANGSLYRNNNVKISCPWVRHYQDQIDIPYTAFPPSAYDYDVKINRLLTNQCISPHSQHSVSDTNAWPWSEIYRDCDNEPAQSTWLHLSFQDNRIMQLFSPDALLSTPQLASGMKFRPVASLLGSQRNVRSKMIYVDTNDIKDDKTTIASTNAFNASLYGEDEGGSYVHANGYIGPNKPWTSDNGLGTEQLIHYYRGYDANQAIVIKTDGSPNDYAILGSPELSRHDSLINTYNNETNYRYTNSLQSILADGRVEFIRGSNNNAWDIPVYGVDAVAAQNITIVENGETPYESLFENAFLNAGKSITSSDNVLLAEIVRDYTSHSSSQYGGRYYEDRSINKYMQVGEYKELSVGVNTYKIINNGDTFVGNFIFARIARAEGAQFSRTRIQMSEIISIPVETSINIFNRNDASFGTWNSTFLPTDSEFHEYNNVFSQESNAIINQPDPFLFIKNTSFTNRILATKPKIAGEIIDSWTDILPNEELYLEGEYGAINRLIKYNDNIYSFQRDGVSIVSVLPRVQINPSDSIAIELGTGNVLNNYQYINTNSGCDDFDGVISTSSAVYYGDRIRRTINIIDGVNIAGLSDVLGISTYVKGYDTNLQHKPKYVCGFDPITDDVLFSIQRQSSGGNGTIETLVYNEKEKKFISILDMSPSFMFTVDGKFYSISSSGKNTVWNHFLDTNMCKFYGTQYELELTICLNPEGAENDVIFNSLEWTHDVVNTTNPNLHYDENITYLKTWNDYLTSLDADINTILRRFRMSRIFIPRSNSDSLSRMRGNYLFAKIKYLPSSSSRTIILNDIILYYNGQR